MILRTSALLLAFLNVVPILAVDAAVKPVELAAYQRCFALGLKEDSSVADILAACRASADAGVPGAQYIVGATLFSRNEAGDRTAAMELLEKATASGNPAAAFGFAGLLLQEQSAPSTERASALLRQSICAGYPPAIEVLQKQGLSPDQLKCEPAADADFTGEWVADLKWVKAEPVGETMPQLKLLFKDNDVQVFMKIGEGWQEIKPGRFKLTHAEQSITVSVIDTGWDFDGKWIEAMTIHLLRTGMDEASMSYLRTVNNAHVPNTFTWRAFSTIAEGKAHRKAKS